MEVWSHYHGSPIQLILKRYHLHLHNLSILEWLECFESSLSCYTHNYSFAHYIGDKPDVIFNLKYISQW